VGYFNWEKRNQRILFSAVVDGLIHPRHKARDGASDEDPPWATRTHRTHVTAHLVNEIDRASAIGIKDVPHFIEVLIATVVAPVVVNVGEQCLNQTPLGCGAGAIPMSLLPLERAEIS
jgi:hypothetical protein